MSFKYLRRIPSEEDIISQLPFPAALHLVKRKRDREIIDCIEGKSSKLLVVIGPCSADNEDAVTEYAHRLSLVQQEVAGRLILVPRVYTNKPRTTGTGYKGMMHQPDPRDKPHIVKGLRLIRQMHLRVLKESGLTAADEMLYPENYPFLHDLLSYVAVGARSVENQQHRLTVSGLDIPVGMKNPTSGDMNVMLNSVQAAHAPHVFIYNRWEVRTSGNPLTHCIVRGAVNTHGQSIPNYHYEDLVRLAELYDKRSLRNPAVIVDTNHANSDKLYREQPRIVMEVMRSRARSRVLRRIVKGFMVESYLAQGCQPPSGRIFGKSITDPCLGWEDSKTLLLRLADAAS